MKDLKLKMLYGSLRGGIFFNIQYPTTNNQCSTAEYFVRSMGILNLFIQLVEEVNSIFNSK
jgi:hypothetical protein